MKQIASALFFAFAFFITSCVTPVATTGNGNMNANEGNPRNWVMIMHGETCGNADEVASNMYVENDHDTKTITVVVDIQWTESNQPRHENKTLSVAPNSKALIGCDHRNGQYLRMEIVSAQYAQ